MADSVIGRQAELHVLSQFLDSVAEGTTAVVIDGTAGVGKTTLWQATRTEGLTRGFRVLTARPVEAETAFSFAALGDLLSDALGHVLSALPSPQRRALSIALLREEPDDQPLEHRAVAVATRTALAVLAQDSPVVVAVDDAQWLDASTTGVLSFLVRRLRTEPVGLLISSRGTESAALPLGLDRALPPDRLRRLTLDGLSFGATHVLLRERLDTVLSRPALRRIHDVSGGNPFFALELGRALMRQGVMPLPGMPLPIPARLNELVLQRLKDLPASTRARLVEVAASAQPVLGPGDERLLADALSRHILAVEGGRLRFEHPLIAAAVYASAAESERRAAHARLAEGSSDVEEAARHLALASADPDEATAARIEDAAQAALARGAIAAAAELTELARHRTPPANVDGLERRTVDAAARVFEAGDPVRACQLLEGAARVARPDRRPEILTRLARANLFASDHRAAAALYREVLGSDVLPDQTRAEAEGGLAVSMMRMLTDLPTAGVHARQAVTCARRSGDRALQAELMAVEALVTALAGDPAAAGRMADAVRLHPAGREADEISSAAFLRAQGPSFMQGVLLAWSDDLAGARARLVATRERALHLGDEASEPLILRHLAHLELLAGNLTTAARLVEQGLAVADETGQLSQRAVLLGVRAMVDAVGGDEVRARGSAEESIALSTSSGAMFGWALAQGALGMLDLSLGDAEQAYVHLGPLVGHLDAAGVQEPGAVRADADAIECLIRLGRTDEAARGLERLEERATRIGRPSALANAARCRGLLAAQDDLPRAIAHLQRGLALHGRAAFPVDRARTLLALGSTLRRMRRWREARAALDTAAIELESLGAPLWLARAVDERGRIGGRAPSPGGLTPTESRIAGLVAQGRSNREVAASLFITVKTVEANLTRIYAKLGVSSRTALAHRLAESAAPSGPAVHHGGSPDSGQPSAL